MIIQLKNASKYFADHSVFEGLNLAVNKGDRIGLVGKNGAGKTTLLRVLAGTMEIDDGEIYKLPGLTVGYLKQDIDFLEKRSLFDEMISVNPKIIQLEQDMKQLEQQMENAAEKDPETQNGLLEKYGQAQNEYDWHEGYSFRAKISSILNGLGFAKDRYDDSLDTLSGGEKMRLHLGKLLLQEPDLLLLDEPNNHLDLKTLEWLEEYLQNWDKALVIISHDRDFLDHVVSSIAELEEGRLRVYKTNYTGFLQEKEERLQQEEEKYEQQQKEIKKMNDFITRFRAKATKARQAKSKEKVLERMEKVSRSRVKQKRMKVRFGQQRRSEKDVLIAKNLAKQYGSHQVLNEINFSLKRGDRVGIIGPNGVGKSTLLRLLVGKEKPCEGSIEKGSKVETGFFAQNLPLISEDHTVLNEMMKTNVFTENEARDLLGLFLFSGEEVFKKVRQLSGGERNRLALAKLVTRQANLLVLDEPTNHLDIASREVLEQALNDYPGTVVLVSHDRYFLRKVTNRIFVLTEAGLHDYPGGYESYLEKHKQEQDSQEEQSRLDKKKNKNKKKEDLQAAEEEKRKEQQKKQDVLEIQEEIQQLEEKKKRIEQKMTSADLYDDGKKVQSTAKEYKEIQDSLDLLYQRWEALE